MAIPRSLGANVSRETPSSPSSDTRRASPFTVTVLINTRGAGVLRRDRVLSRRETPAIVPNQRSPRRDASALQTSFCASPSAVVYRHVSPLAGSTSMTPLMVPKKKRPFASSTMHRTFAPVRLRATLASVVRRRVDRLSRRLTVPSGPTIQSRPRRSR